MVLRGQGAQVVLLVTLVQPVALVIQELMALRDQVAQQVRLVIPGL